MSKVLILGRQDSRRNYDTPQSFYRELQKVASRVEYSWCNLEDLLFQFDHTGLRVLCNGKKDVRDFDAIFLEGWFKTKKLEDIALSVAYYAQYYHVQVFNSEIFGNRSKTKLSQYVIAALNNLSTIYFVSSLNISLYTEAEITDTIGFPCIVKGVQASRGKDNYLVTSYLELKKILEKNHEIFFVIQKFVPNNGDYRIIVINQAVVMAIHRKTESASHLNNTSQGGTATNVLVNKLSDAMKRDAIVISKLMKREITGVDMIIDSDTGNHYLLEINNMPQLSTGALVAEKIQKLDEFFESSVSKK